MAREPGTGNGEPGTTGQAFEPPARVLVAGVGYRNLRDHSLGVMVTDRLAALGWPAEVSVEDLSYNPIAVVQRLEDDLPAQRFGRVIFVSALSRSGRLPGTVTAYRWDGMLPGDDEIHRAVCDAVTGVIHLDNTLIVARHFGALPDEVVVIEVEPFAHEFGDTFSAPVAEAFAHVCALVTSLVRHSRESGRLAVTPLGGARAWIPAANENRA